MKKTYYAVVSDDGCVCGGSAYPDDDRVEPWLMFLTKREAKLHRDVFQRANPEIPRLHVVRLRVDLSDIRAAGL